MQLSEMTFVVTGANTGLGKATVEALASKQVGRIVVASRSRDKTQPVLDALKARSPKTDVQFVALDLGDLASVRRAADEILAKDHTIDVLVNNAGIAALVGQTKDGFELTFGTNHLGPWLFTEKLLPLVKRAEQGRIVNVSSQGHYRCKGIDWDAQKRPTAHATALPEYFVSKLCNVLHANELARRLAGTNVTTYSLHPGGVATDIWGRRLGKLSILLRPFLLTMEEGAKTQVRCATDPALSKESGLYYTKEKPREPNPLAHDVALQDELRRRSEEWTRG